MAEEKQLDCPSAPHQHPEARLLGVVLEEEGAPRVAYVEKGVDLPEDFNAEKLGVDPGHALRFAAPCANKGCGQWKEGGCGLGREIIKRLQPVVDVAPACTLRATCRWFAENGTASCLRCPQIVTRRKKSDAVSPHVHATPSPVAPRTAGNGSTLEVRVVERKPKMTKKAGRVDSADLTAALGQAGDLAKARIVQLDATTLDAIAGGSGSTGPDITPTIPDITDIATDGMAPADPDPWLDFLNGGDSSEF